MPIKEEISNAVEVEVATPEIEMAETISETVEGQNSVEQKESEETALLLRYKKEVEQKVNEKVRELKIWLFKRESPNLPEPMVESRWPLFWTVSMVLERQVF